MIQEEFVPVAIDQWYQRRQQDAEGEFYRKIAAQGPRSDFNQTTQGHYACDASGKLLGFNGNHVDLARIKSFMTKAIKDFDADLCKDTKVIEKGTPDAKYDYKPPVDGLVVRVCSKVLGGYAKPKNARAAAFQKSVGMDNLWITADEKQELIKVVREDGEFPSELAYRIARFHLIDNTRGEPPRWDKEQIKSIELKVSDGHISGRTSISTDDSKRGYEAELFGYVEFDGEEVTRFDLVAKGEFWGEGRHTPSAPEGKFPLAITFRLGDSSSTESRAIPHGGKGWIEGYYQCAN